MDRRSHSPWSFSYGGGADERAAAEEELERFEHACGMWQDPSDEFEARWSNEASARHEPVYPSADDSPSGFDEGSCFGNGMAGDSCVDPPDDGCGDVPNRRSAKHSRYDEMAGKRRKALKYDDRPDDDPDGEFVCAYCGRRYNPGVNPDRFGGGFFTNTSKTYCSRRCRNDAGIVRRRAKPKRARIATCPSCGKAFEAPRKNAEYCSNACRQKAYRKRERARCDGGAGSAAAGPADFPPFGDCADNGDCY